MSEELKPCPFCGSKSVSVEDNGDVCVVCNACGGMWYPGISDLDYDSERFETIKLWNERVTDTKAARRWEAGSEPPDGLYWAIYKDNERAPAYICEREIYMPVTSYINFVYFWALEPDCMSLLGPLPEPEVKA
jgi:hypothetical protein